MTVKHETPVKLAGLAEGAKYSVRVYSREYDFISSKTVPFETSAGEAGTPLHPHSGVCTGAVQPKAGVVLF